MYFYKKFGYKKAGHFPARILNLQANCEWDGQMNKKDFIDVVLEIVAAGCDQMEDVKAAFKVFDHNNDGSISKEELREAMLNLGTRCTEE